MRFYLPTVSVIVACRNEEDHIEACVHSIVAQDLPPGDFEIIIIDGMSEDNTRSILQRMARQYACIQLMDNPFKAKPYALNIAIQAAQGRFVAILDAHTEYSSDYLSSCLKLFEEHPEASCVGGPIISRGKGLFGRATAAVMSHPAGIGNAKHRLPSYEGYAEGACFPMFRKEIFAKVGLFDESLTHNQDDEFNYRLAISGEKVFISPRARCIYFVRETPSQLFHQYFGYGFWRVAVLRKHRLPASVRQLVPPLFMFLMLIVAFLGLLLPGWWRLTAAVLPLVYGATLLSIGVSEVGKAGWRAALLFPVAAAIMHAAYAAGFVRGVLKSVNRPAHSLHSNEGACHVPRT
jgi:glycosyltransferase involved in cell wall biosynthesis